MGGCEVRIQVRMEPTVEYHSVNVLILTLDRNKLKIKNEKLKVYVSLCDEFYNFIK